MDSKNNIDQLFREKLFSQEVAPSAIAWDQVSGRINKKKPVILYWIAASITAILAISIVFWPVKEAEMNLAISEVNHPTIIEQQDIRIPNRELAEKVKAIYATANNETDRKGKAAIDKQNMDVLFVAMEEFQIEAKAPSLAMNWPVNEMVNIKKYEPLESPTVKITYIASNTGSTEANDTKMINRFWSVAQNLTNQSVLADLRDAKNNLFTKNAP